MAISELEEVFAISAEDAKKVEGIFEDGFHSMNINQVFMLGLITGSANLRDITEETIKSAKERGLLNKCEIKEIVLTDQIVKGIYAELKTSTGLRNACKTFCSLETSAVWHPIFETSKPGKKISVQYADRVEIKNATGPRNSAFYSGELLRDIKENSCHSYFKDGKEVPLEHIPLITNNIIAVYQHETSGHEMTNEFKKALAKELVPMFLAEGVVKLIEDDNSDWSYGKINHLYASLRWAKVLAEESRVQLPPVYKAMASLINLLDYNKRESL